MRAGVLGGTFDPVHLGHLLVAEAARVSLGLDVVLFIPAGQPYFKAGQPVSDAGHRLAMVELAVASNPHFTASDIEVARAGPTYTVDTLTKLRDRSSGTDELFLLLGMDAVVDLDTWRRPDEIRGLCTVVGLARPGVDVPDEGLPGGTALDDGPAVDISASDIRRRVAVGLSIRYMVPRPVEEYILRHRLYRGGQPDKEERGMGRSAAAILDLAKRLGALSFGEFRLSAGGTSSYYFDGRLLTLDPAGAYAIAIALLPVLAECGAEAIAGPTLGADPIVSAVAAVSHAEGRPISGAIVRKEVKGHGGGRMIEGPLRAGARVAVVDDACTSGASLFHAIDAVEAAGCRVVKVVAVLDRREGGSDEIRRRGYDFLALLQATDQGHIGPVEGGRAP